MFESQMDVASFYEKGFVRTSLSDAFASKLLLEVKSEHWVRVKKESNEDGSLKRQYKDRYISKKGLFQPKRLRPAYSELLEGLRGYLDFVLSKYDLRETGDTLTPFLGMSGYMMEPHSDLGDRALIIVIVYLSDDVFDSTTGGELNFYNAKLSEDGEVLSRELSQTVYPNNGSVVIINPNDPRFEHEVREVVGDLKRYQLFITMGTESLNDWDVEFVEKKGLVETDTEYAMGKPSPEWEG